MGDFLERINRKIGPDYKVSRMSDGSYFVSETKTSKMVGGNEGKVVVIIKNISGETVGMAEVDGSASLQEALDNMVENGMSADVLEDQLRTEEGKNLRVPESIIVNTVLGSDGNVTIFRTLSPTLPLSSVLIEYIEKNQDKFQEYVEAIEEEYNEAYNTPELRAEQDVLDWYMVCKALFDIVTPNAFSPIEPPPRNERLEMYPIDTFMPGFLSQELANYLGIDLQTIIQIEYDQYMNDQIRSYDYTPDQNTQWSQWKDTIDGLCGEDVEFKNRVLGLINRDNVEIYDEDDE